MNYIDEIADKIALEVGDGPLDDEYRPLFRIYAVLALTVGRDVTLRNVHDAWSAWRAETQPDHRSLVVFDDLSDEVKELDRPYADAIAKVAPTLWT